MSANPIHATDPAVAWLEQKFEAVRAAAVRQRHEPWAATEDDRALLLAIDGGTVDPMAAIKPLMTRPMDVVDGQVVDDFPSAPARSGAGWPGCTVCWRDRDASWRADPSSTDVLYMCRECDAALRAGRKPDLPVGAELGEVWERIALWAYRLRLDPDVVDEALLALAPLIAPAYGRDLVETVQDAVLRLERAEDPGTVLDSEVTGPDLDAESYVNHWRRVRDNAVRALAGGAL